MIFIALAVLGTHWVFAARRSTAATANADEMILKYTNEVVSRLDVILALQEALDADLAVPMHSARGAYESHMRRLANLRLLAEREFPATGLKRPIVEFTSNYELARRQLANIAGEDHAIAVDREFDFPYRDQYEGHPAAEVGK